LDTAARIVRAEERVAEEQRRRPGNGPGAGYVPRGGLILFSALAVVFAVVGLYSLWSFWPEVGQGDEPAGPQDVSWFTWSLSLSREFLFFLSVALAGTLGGLIHTIRSFAWYVGNRDLRWSWVPFNLLLPVVGALAGTVFYLVLRAGLFSPSTSVDNASPFGFAAIAVLAGLFSQQAFEKLRLIARDVFTDEPTGADSVRPHEE
jgi:hypothetical protein